MDTALNGEAVVHHNVYQAFLLTAVKLLAYLKALRQPPGERARTCLCAYSGEPASRRAARS